MLEDLTRGQTLLAEFFESVYWPKDAQRNLALNTRKSYLSVWYVHLKPRLGHLQLRQLTPPVVQAFREQMEEDGVGTSTTKRAMAILQAVCRYAPAKARSPPIPSRPSASPPFAALVP